MILDIILLTALVLAAMVTVMTARMLRAVVGLALASAILTVVMFRLESPLAGVFELSVCAGLIPAILVTTISLTQRLSPEALAARKQEKFRAYWLLPIIVIIAGVLLSRVQFPADAVASPETKLTDVRAVMWTLRHMDILGQIIVLLGGVFAVLVLVTEPKDAK